MNKEQVYKYIVLRYKNIYNEKISPIKLQKSTYFLFAYYGGWVKSFVGDDTEIDYKFSKYLFEDAKFMAWDYGPVEVDIYRLAKDDLESVFSLSYEDYRQTLICQYGSTLISFIDNFVDQFFKINDFALVDISHQDKCWSDIYVERKDGKMVNAKQLRVDAIVDEYATKFKTFKAN